VIEAFLESVGKFEARQQQSGAFLLTILDRFNGLCIPSKNAEKVQQLRVKFK
jgi:hypothetical protein